jgi:hypothetical protein
LGLLKLAGNVNTRIAFDVIDQSSFSYGWGMSSFNASLAKNVSLIADQLIQAQLAMFLFDTSRAVDITPGDLRSIPCSHGPTNYIGIPCERTFFMPGGVEFAAPDIDSSDDNSISQVFLTEGQQGYILSFQEGTDQKGFDEENECRVYGFPFAAFNLCLSNTKSNAMEART